MCAGSAERQTPEQSAERQTPEQSAQMEYFLRTQRRIWGQDWEMLRPMTRQEKTHDWVKVYHDDVALEAEHRKVNAAKEAEMRRMPVMTHPEWEEQAVQGMSKAELRAFYKSQRSKPIGKTQKGGRPTHCAGFENRVVNHNARLFFVGFE